MGLGAVPEFCFNILGLEPGVELELAYADCCTGKFHSNFTFQIKFKFVTIISWSSDAVRATIGRQDLSEFEDLSSQHSVRACSADWHS